MSIPRTNLWPIQIVSHSNKHTRPTYRTRVMKVIFSERYTARMASEVWEEETTWNAGKFVWWYSIFNIMNAAEIREPFPSYAILASTRDPDRMIEHWKSKLLALNRLWPTCRGWCVISSQRRVPMMVDQKRDGHRSKEASFISPNLAVNFLEKTTETTQRIKNRANQLQNTD